MAATLSSFCSRRTTSLCNFVLSDENLREELLAAYDFRFALRFCAPGGCARHVFLSLQQL